MKPRSRSDKGDEMGEAGEVLLAKMRFGHTNRHFIIIYISSAWQGEGKISKNVTNKQTDTSSLYIYRQLGRGKGK